MTGTTGDQKEMHGLDRRKQEGGMCEWLVGENLGEKMKITKP